MRWGLPTAQAMIALRVVLANERWEQTWPQIPAQQRQTRRACGTARRQARRQRTVVVATPVASLPLPPVPVAAPPSPVTRRKLVQDGRPTAAQPWRQPFIRRVSSAATKM